MEKEIKILVEIPEEIKKELKYVQKECFPDKTEEELCRLAIQRGLECNQET